MPCLQKIHSKVSILLAACRIFSKTIISLSMDDIEEGSVCLVPFCLRVLRQQLSLLGHLLGRGVHMFLVELGRRHGLFPSFWIF